MAFHRPLAAAFVAVFLGLLAVPAAAQLGVASGDELAETQGQRFSGPPEQPRRHYRVQNPAGLSASQAEAVYDDLRGALAERYAQSGDGNARSYQTWTRHSAAPYRSMTHGRRFVNNYANDAARDYGDGDLAGPLPPGAVIAKDSFVVTTDGEISPGPLFVMQKMAPGFNYVTGDWRYSMITADGEFAGETLGAGAERVEFCIACHLARESDDFLFFVPPGFRPGS
ncbi:MAG: cytochrome P460 family protein [Kiloniellaceae bacterium]